MSERELADAMAAAAKRATEACVAQGYSRGDKVTIDSAKAAAAAVYDSTGRMYEPSVPRVVDQPRKGEATEPNPLRDEWAGRKDLA